MYSVSNIFFFKLGLVLVYHIFPQIVLGFLSQTQALSCPHPYLSLVPHSRCFWLSPHSQLFPRSVFWSPIFSTQPLSTLANMCLRLESAVMWQRPPILVSPCSVCYKPAAALPSEFLKLPFCPDWPLRHKGGSGGEETFRFSQISPRRAGPNPIPFCSPFVLLFVPLYPVTWKSFLQLWLYEIFSQHSVGILWELFYYIDQVLMCLWEEVGPCPTLQSWSLPSLDI